MALQSTPSAEAAILKEKVFKNLLYIGIFSIMMLFAGLTSAYIVSQADLKGHAFVLPEMFWYSTGIILLSSATMNLAVQSVKRNKFEAVKIGLIATFILGIIFGFFQYFGWIELYNAGIVFAGKESFAPGSFVYVMSGLHVAHIVSGLAYLLVVMPNALKNKYNSANQAPIKLCGLYWHFLDILWVYLFVFLLVIR